MIRKKKKKVSIDNNIDNNIYNINEDIIKVENNIIAIINDFPNKNIIKINIDDCIDFNYKFMLSYLSYNNTIIYNKLFKLLKVQDKYFFIKHFINNFRIINQFTKKINKYQLIYKVDINNSFFKYDYFIGLIKDDKCIPFWNDNIKKISNNIFLPIDKNLEKVNPPSTFDSNTWFSNKHYMNTNLDDNINDICIYKDRKYNKNFKNKKGVVNYIIKSRKVKMYLSKEQKQYLNKIMGCYRYFYNRAVQYINNYDKITKKTYYYKDYNNKETIKYINLKDEKYIFNFMTIRKYIKDNKPKWMDNIEIQSHLVDKSIIEASENYEKCMNKYKKYKIPFDLKFKTKKDKFQTINIEKVMLNKFTNTLFSGIKINKKSLFKNIKMSENISKYDICDSSITCNIRLNEYFLNLNYHDNFERNKQILENKKVCSIDPGLKCFLNVYSDNYIDQIGIGITSKINKICKEIDIIQSRMTKKEDTKYKLNCKKRRNLKKALHRKIRYLDYLKNELHNKSIKYLCDNFGKIILPKLETQEMACKFNSNLARSLYNLSNYKFINKLQNRCKEYDIELVIRPEYYTSKTCTRCGWLNHDLKLIDRIFKCKECHLKIDRDMNASRNIMLRNN